MRSFFRSFAVPLFAAAALLATAVAPSSAHAQSAQPGPRILKYAYESGQVAAGALITSNVVNTAVLENVTVIADNSAGGSARTLTCNILAKDKATVMYSPATVSVGIAGRGGYVFTTDVTAGTAPAGFTVLQLAPGQYLQCNLAAAGAANGQLAIYGR